MHGTTVAVGEAGVLIRGVPGIGKSDLALRLIDRGATLVADDRTALEAHGSEVVARAPDAIAGKLEVRGLGIARLPWRAEVRVALVVDLVARARVPRLPKAALVDLAGVRVPHLRLSARDASADAKIRLALALGPGDLER